MNIDKRVGSLMDNIIIAIFDDIDPLSEVSISKLVQFQFVLTKYADLSFLNGRQTEVGIRSPGFSFTPAVVFKTLDVENIKAKLLELYPYDWLEVGRHVFDETNLGGAYFYGKNRHY